MGVGGTVVAVGGIDVAVGGGGVDVGGGGAGGFGATVAAGAQAANASAEIVKNVNKRSKDIFLICASPFY